MKPLLAPVVAAVVALSSPNTSAQDTGVPRDSQEIVELQKNVQNSLNVALVPLGLRAQNLRGVDSRAFHIGYPIGETGFSAGITHTKNMKNIGPTPSAEGVRGKTSFRVIFSLDKDIVK